MARKPSKPEKTPAKGGRKGAETEAELSRGRAVPPPPAGLDVMPRSFLADDVRADVKTVVEIEASASERAALAQAYDLPDVAALSAKLTLVRRGPVIHVSGPLKARVTQTCVVTLEPFESEISETVEMEYAPTAYVTEAWERVAKLEAANSPEPIPDPPDQIVDGKIDLGALVAEALALALDPYPKKPGVEFAPPEDLDDGPDESPFAVLARLKGQGGEGERS